MSSKFPYFYEFFLFLVKKNKTKQPTKYQEMKFSHNLTLHFLNNLVNHNYQFNQYN